ncbi:MAG: agmatine deiminase family protein, partial [Campylobacterota bacterium]|nr:agmatine deiminase family protein [Campylobacterota bacterium]
KFQKCLVVCYDINAVKKHFREHKNLYFVKYETDDTWARDCSTLSVGEGSQTELLNFTFNAWGLKFEASQDNAMNAELQKYYSKKMRTVDFVLEGGAVESNGVDTILTTSACMLNKNRNAVLNAEQVTQKLNAYFGATKVLYLEHGYLAGDDTDSHIDTLARFIDTSTIMYVKCKDESDEHFDELRLMERELQEMADKHNFKLIPLPMSDAICYEEERLPATYANFLFVNGAVLVPTYGVKQDEVALKIFKDTFTQREIVEVDCSVLIRQHGSLHCVTMNFASGVSLLV